MSLQGICIEKARTIVVADRREATAEEEAILQELERHGWRVGDYRTGILPRPPLHSTHA